MSPYGVNKPQWVNPSMYIKWVHPLSSGELNYVCTVELLKFRDDWIMSSQTLLGMWLLIHAGIKVNQEVGVPTGRFCINFLRNIKSRARKGLMVHIAKALPHPHRKKIVDILQTTFSNAFLVWKISFYSISLELSLKIRTGLGSNTYLYLQIQIKIRRICIFIWSNFKPRICICIWSTVYVFKYTFFLGPAISKHEFMEHKLTWIFPINRLISVNLFKIYTEV